MNECCKKAVRQEWAAIVEWKPYLHFCSSWDFLLIDRGDAEFEACHCYSEEELKNPALIRAAWKE